MLLVRRSVFLKTAPTALKKLDRVKYWGTGASVPSGRSRIRNRRPPIKIIVTSGRGRVTSAGPIGNSLSDNQRAKSRNPGLSPTTVICPVQGVMSSSRTMSPACNCLVSPSVTVIENTPRSTVNS